MSNTARLLLIIAVSVLNVQARYSSFQGFNKVENKHSVSQNASLCGQPWFIFDNSSGQCVCGAELNGIVSCDNEDKKVYIHNCYCMTHDTDLGTTVGSCFTNCVVEKSMTKYKRYIKVPRSLNELNKVICGEHWNRNGRLCGECEPGLYPLAYSYNMSCVNCTHANAGNWVKYISSAFVPLTVFFIIVVVSGISATSPQLEAYIHFAQIITTPANVRIILEVLSNEKYYNYHVNVFTRLIISLYGIWNLDFFRTLWPQNCLKIGTLKLLGLEYAIAVYPLALIVVTYFIIDLYDRQFYLFVWILKPIGRYLKSFDNLVNIKSSILNVFVTFVLLSYSKFLTVSFDLLVFNNVYAPNGKSVGRVLFYDASIDYFGQQHLPFGILAIIIVFFFIIAPLFFALIHPLKFCKGHLGKWPTLRICLDSLQGYYKDGTDKTRDCRFFSPLYLIIRICLFLVYGVVKDGSFYPIAAVFLLLLASFILIFQPFKRRYNTYNSTHGLLFLNLAVWCIIITCMNFNTVKSSFTEKCTLALLFVIPIFPLFYVMGVLLKWLYSKQHLFMKHCRFCPKQRIRLCMEDSTVGNSYTETESDESLPHRMQNVSEEKLFHTSLQSDVYHYGAIQQGANSSY